MARADPGGPAAVRAEAADWSRLVDHSGTPRERAARMISVIFPPAVALDFDREFGELAAEAQALSTRPPRRGRAGDGPVVGDLAGSRERDPIAPVLIGHGAEDIVIPPGNAELLAARFPGARVELFADAEHAFPAQRSEAAADLLASHFRP